MLTGRSLLLRSVVMLALLVVTSCTNLGRSSFHGNRGLCVPDADVAGIWRSRRESQVGASTVTLELDCNCRYRMTISLAVGRMTEEGEYRILNDQLVFSRAKGDTSWPFRIAGDTLVITESETETHEYKRMSGAGSCRESGR